MSELGTKAQFRGWLLSKHNLTYTAYTKLKTEAKESISVEYRKRKGKDV